MALFRFSSKIHFMVSGVIGRLCLLFGHSEPSLSIRYHNEIPSCGRQLLYDQQRMRSRILSALRQTNPWIYSFNHEAEVISHPRPLSPSWPVTKITVVQDPVRYSRLVRLASLLNLILGLSFQELGTCILPYIYYDMPYRDIVFSCQEVA